MTFVYPDFYDDFACIASRCRHSCCRGWEIDVDRESLARYRAMKGPWGETLRRVIREEPEPHFVLTPEENCPFLREDGLCRMILELGEESLCDICREHPRFYNELPDRLEMGLGLCCEEAVRLLLEREGPLTLLEESEGESAPLSPKLRTRQALLEALREEKIPLWSRMERAMALAGGTLQPISLREAARFYQSLEQMDGAWMPLLRELEAREGEISAHPEGLPFARIGAYFLYRHFTPGRTPRERMLRARFAFLTVELLWALECLHPGGLPEQLRLYSGEIEYSDENVEAILAFLDTHMEKASP